MLPSIQQAHDLFLFQSQDPVPLPDVAGVPLLQGGEGVGAVLHPVRLQVNVVPQAVLTEVQDSQVALLQHVVPVARAIDFLEARSQPPVAGPGVELVAHGSELAPEPVVLGAVQDALRRQGPRLVAFRHAGGRDHPLWALSPVLFLVAALLLIAIVRAMLVLLFM